MNEPTNPPDPPSDSTPPPPPPPPFTPPPTPSAPATPPPSTPIAPPRPPVYTPPPGEPPKKSTMPWVLGGCGCLALIVILAAIISWMVYRAKQRVNELQTNLRSSLEQPSPPQRRTTSSPAPTTPASRTTPSNQTSVPRAGWNIYVNQKDKLPSGLQSKFVAFSFQYPRTFEVQPQSDANFVKVEKYAPSGKGNTSENFAVGYARFDDPNTQNEALYNQLLDQLGQQLSGGFHNYKELKRNYTTVDAIKCRTALFQADFANAPQIQIFGKTIVVHPPGKEYGVTILMLGTSMSRDVKSADDLGTKGDTADIVRSFTFL